MTALLPPFAEAVAAERRSQDAKWGPQRHGYGDWRSVLGEEVGEACEAANRLIWHDDGWPFGQLDNRRLLRAELVQVAAVCAAIIEQIDEQAEPLIAAMRSEEGS